jgi:hypothetical protein
MAELLALLALLTAFSSPSEDDYCGRIENGYAME